MGDIVRKGNNKLADVLVTGNKKSNKKNWWVRTNIREDMPPMSKEYLPKIINYLQSNGIVYPEKGYESYSDQHAKCLGIDHISPPSLLQKVLCAPTYIHMQISEFDIEDIAVAILATRLEEEES